MSTTVDSETSAEAAARAAAALVALRLGDRDLVVDLERVAEVVRLGRLTPLEGSHPALAGVLDVRGHPLPVYDVRETSGEGAVVVLVPRPGEEPVGVAVDTVSGVVDAADLPVVRGALDLPGYVVDVRRGPAGPVFRVDLRALALGHGSLPSPAAVTG